MDETKLEMTGILGDHPILLTLAEMGDRIDPERHPRTQ
jgi:hypothetical protein